MAYSVHFGVIYIQRLAGKRVMSWHIFNQEHGSLEFQAVCWVLGVMGYHFFQFFAVVPAIFQNGFQTGIPLEATAKHEATDADINKILFHILVFTKI